MINDTVNGGFQPKASVSASGPVLSAASNSASATAAPVQERAPAVPVDNKQLAASVRKLNDHLQNMQRTLSFSVEESTGRTVISVYDSETDELIRQIPSEEVLRLLEQFQSGNAGLLVQDSV